MTDGYDDVLDQGILASIADLGREPGKLLEEMIGLFVDEAPALMADIDAALAEGSTAHIARAAHRLKGAAAHIGALRLSRTAGEVEARARAGGQQEALSTAAAVRGELSMTLDALGRVVT